MTLQTPFEGFARPVRPARLLAAAGRALLRPVLALRRQWRNRRDAEHLAELPDYLLADVGIERVGIELVRCGGRPGARRP